MPLKDKKAVIVGLTGSVASGKSLVLNYLEKQHYPVLNADLIAKEITQKGSKTLESIRSIFGDKSIDLDGELNRAFIRSRILEDKSLREKLNSIMHPEIQKRSKEQFQALINKGSKIVIYEAPLLFEAKSNYSMDYIICIIAPEELIIKRLKKRDKVDEEQAKKLLKTQLDQDTKAKMSDFVIHNDNDLESLYEDIEKIMNEIKQSLS